MSDMMVVFLIFSALIIGSVLTYIIVKIQVRSGGSGVDLLKADMHELNRTVNTLQSALGEKLERSSTTMQQSVQRQLAESMKLVHTVSDRLAKLDETNRRVVDVADELRTLQNVLQNPKQRGVFGEYYLESVLSNILPTRNFKMQYGFKGGVIADAVIILDKGKLLPVDSKFSLENYNRMVEAPQADKAVYLKKVRLDLKARIDETSKYIRPEEGTMDFAFMFIPSESLYYDLLIGDVGTGSSARDLIEYAFRERQVIIVSPTSFMAYLQTVLQGLRSLQIEEQAKDIQTHVRKLGRHIASFDAYMHKLGKALSVTVGHYNTAHKELEKIDKDVVKISAADKAVEPLSIDRPTEE